MKTTKLIVLAATAMLAMAACRKDKTTSLINPTIRPTKADFVDDRSRPVTQKTYNLSSSEVIKVIKKFKHLEEANPNNNQARLIEADSVKIDSAIYVLEAALNYDFDYNSENAGDQLMDINQQNVEITIPIARINVTLSSNDLEDAYTEFSEEISAFITSTDKIKVINVSAYLVGNNQVTFVAAMSITEAEPFSPNCNANTNNLQAVIFGQLNSPASDKLQYYLRYCDFPINYWCQNKFFTNVVTKNFTNVNNNYPSALYYRFFPPVLATADVTLLLPAQLITFRTGCINLIQNQITSAISPVTSLHIPTKVDITGYAIPSPGWQSGNALNQSFWNLDVDYAVPNARCN
jgi:hypothetical protein